MTKVCRVRCCVLFLPHHLPSLPSCFTHEQFLLLRPFFFVFFSLRCVALNRSLLFVFFFFYSNYPYLLWPATCNLQFAAQLSRKFVIFASFLPWIRFHDLIITCSHLNHRLSSLFHLHFITFWWVALPWRPNFLILYSALPLSYAYLRRQAKAKEKNENWTDRNPNTRLPLTEFFRFHIYKSNSCGRKCLDTPLLEVCNRKEEIEMEKGSWPWSSLSSSFIIVFFQPSLVYRSTKELSVFQLYTFDVSELHLPLGQMLRLYIKLFFLGSSPWLNMLLFPFITLCFVLLIDH